MKKYYYEVTIIPSSHKDEIESFLMDRFYNGIEEKDNALILRSEEPLTEIIEKTKEYTKILEEIFGQKIDVEIREEKKENRDWIESYKKSITPVNVGEFYIHPTWYEGKKDKIDIIIDPALAFGSGHHPSTLNCLKLLDEIVKKGDRVLDVGCGSGILSIAAAKKGALPDICDTDEIAIKEAKKNFRLNQVEFGDAWVGSAGAAKEKYDIVIANIVADILIYISKDLKKALKDDGFLILSGIVEKYKDKVLEKYLDMQTIKIIKDEEWVTILLKKVKER
ncbi:50S ribosomal protein L11 methyltransferase [Nitrosophilus alvini]|uniref:50S ribosomal protein L11 methyltransferase n=1 Tax=Nitrosophilus alvini TaxID=2714855 RepID=UPI00190E43B5|nr:50S ribosomal protein L11 methyltransferase [Nitrosophilus alvini]